MPLQIRRGLAGDLTSAITPSAGEPIYTTDTGKLYIGDGTTNGATLAPINPDIALDGLTGVAINPFSLADGDVLLYNGTTSLWANQPLSLSIFSDLQLSQNPASGEVITYDGDFASPTFGKYVNRQISITDLSDVSTTAPTNGQILAYNATAGEYVPQVNNSRIADAADVTLTSVSNGQILAYDAVTSTWKNQANTATSSLDGLTDVTITSASNGQALVYNSSTSQWVNQAIAVSSDLNGLTDVTISTVADNQILRYDSSTSQWKNEAIGVNSLDDVVISSIADGQALIYESATGKWKNQTLSGGGALALDGLTNVNATSPSNGDVISYDSATSTWVTGAPATGASSVSTLTDVSITSLADGQALIYNASTGDWENQTLSSGGTLALDGLTDVSASSPNDGDVIAWSSSSSQWVTVAPSGGSGGGLQSRTTAAGSTTFAVSPGQSGLISINVAKTFALHRIQTNDAAWVTVYTDYASYTADSTRSRTTDPAPGSGVIAEVITTGAATQQLTPGVIGFDNESTPTGSISVRVYNDSSTAQVMTVTLHFVALEA